MPSGIVTTGWPAVKAKGLELGIAYDAWQEGAGRIALGKRADGKYASTIGGITWSIPRQVGKTFLVGSLLIILCVLFPGLTVLWTAHRTRTATKTFQSMQGMCRRRKIWPHVLHFRTANGEQEIRFRNGSVIMFGAREQGFGRGFDQVDVEVFDEAQILTEKALEDMVPATNQAQHEHGALLFFIGTPPRPTDPGEVFTNRRAKALDGKAPNGAYIEFSADDDAKLDDHEQWRKANPSFPSRTPLESMLRMRENLGSDEAWKREALGIWDSTSVNHVIPPSVWRELASTADLPPEPVAYAVEISPAGMASIGVAVPNGDGVHVELAAHGPTEFGSSWVADWLIERRKKPVAVVIDGASPAHMLVPTLTAAKVDVTVTGPREMATAFAGFVDAVKAGTLSHRDNPLLNVALAGAQPRDIGREGGQGWDRRTPNIDLTPLVAVTLAKHGLAINSKSRGRAYVQRRVV